MMITIPVYIGAAVAEIAGCFAFWAWLRWQRPFPWFSSGPILLC